MARAGQLSTDLKQARQAAGLNQSELAAAIGVEQATVSRWERGAEPTLENLALLSKFFSERGVEFRYLESIAEDIAMKAVKDRIDFVPVVGRLVDRGFVKPLQDSMLRDLMAPSRATPYTRAIIVDTHEHHPYFEKESVLYFEDIGTGHHCMPGQLGFGRGDRKEMVVGELFRGNAKDFYSMRTPSYSTAGLALQFTVPIWMVHIHTRIRR